MPLHEVTAPLSPGEDAEARAESRKLLRDLISELVTAREERERAGPFIERMALWAESQQKAEAEAREERKAERTRTDEADKRRNQNWLVVFDKSASAFQHPLLLGAAGSALPWVGVLLARWLGLPVPLPGEDK